MEHVTKIIEKLGGALNLQQLRFNFKQIFQNRLKYERINVPAT